jgi:sugar lactone lactonase YvrE
MRRLTDATRWRAPQAPPRPAPTHRPEVDVLHLPGPGPEDVVVDLDGQLVVGVEDGRILRVAPDDGTVSLVADTGGRPLGIEALDDGSLLVCDGLRGLLHVVDGEVRVLVEEVCGRPFTWASNAVVTRDGTTYFTESSSAHGFADNRLEVLAHSASGAVFRLDPDGRVSCIAAGLRLANGLALAPDDASLIVAETFGYRLTRLGLDGAERRPFVENLPGMPDNISTGSDGLIWVALPAPRNTGLDALVAAPPLLREVVARLPERLQPQPARDIWVQAYDVDGRLVHDIQGAHPDLGIVTAVAEQDGVIWLGSLESSAIGRIAIPA